jgi:hypothetical protein
MPGRTRSRLSGAINIPVWYTENESDRRGDTAHPTDWGYPRWTCGHDGQRSVAGDRDRRIPASERADIVSSSGGVNQIEYGRNEVFQIEGRLRARDATLGSDLRPAGLGIKPAVFVLHSACQFLIWGDFGRFGPAHCP